VSGGSGGRVMSLDAVLTRIAAWRAAGEKIALAHGAFDLLNLEHAKFLAGARQGAARLVVIVARSEAGAAVYQSEDERARLVAALRGVDAVALGNRAEAEALAAEAQARLAIESGLAARTLERVRAAHGKP